MAASNTVRPPGRQREHGDRWTAALGLGASFSEATLRNPVMRACSQARRCSLSVPRRCAGSDNRTGKATCPAPQEPTPRTPACWPGQQQASVIAPLRGPLRFCLESLYPRVFSGLAELDKHVTCGSLLFSQHAAHVTVAAVGVRLASVAQIARAGREHAPQIAPRELAMSPREAAS